MLGARRPRFGRIGPATARSTRAQRWRRGGRRSGGGRRLGRGGRRFRRRRALGGLLLCRDRLGRGAGGRRFCRGFRGNFLANGRCARRGEWFLWALDSGGSPPSGCDAWPEVSPISPPRSSSSTAAGLPGFSPSAAGLPDAPSSASARSGRARRHKAAVAPAWPRGSLPRPAAELPRATRRVRQHGAAQSHRPRLGRRAPASRRQARPTGRHRLRLRAHGLRARLGQRARREEPVLARLPPATKAPVPRGYRSRNCQPP